MFPSIDGKLASWSLLVATALHNGLTANAQKEAPSASDFLRRSQHGSVVVGDFLYIDGGRLSQNISGSLDTIVPRVQNATLSIDLRSSWTNASVEMTTINRGDTPIFTFPSLWASESSSSFYLWDGMRAPGNAVPNLGVWKFTADGSGSGEWSKVGQSDLATFNSLTRPVGGYSAVLREEVAFYAGGFTSSSTDPAVDTDAEVPVPGIVSYNFSSGAWTNGSAAGFTTYGTQMWGKAAAVPFGDPGLLIFLGGESGSRTALSNAAGQLDLDTVAVYDPAAADNGTWYSQVATGDVPSTRDGFCLVGAQDVSAAGTNGSYELFLYGGWNAGDGGATYNDTYVLSLPAFRWFRGPDASAARLNHGCHAVGKGRRQFVSVGGTDNNVETAERWTDADPWKQGLGVFDMTEMRWTASYDADAAAYEVPSVVREWYQGGDAEPEWSSDSVKALFANVTRTTASSSTPSASSTVSLSSSSGSTNHTGAIVGGVVGGLCGLALIGLAFFLLRRHRSRKQQTPAIATNVKAAGHYPHELSAGQERMELPVQEVKEMEGDYGVQKFGAVKKDQQPVEMEGTPGEVAELDGGGVEGEKRDGGERGPEWR
ncbi:putative kelch repeat protein [Lasiodiplodia theobromae]|nr:putative kelch repeat protein [Lasiodiplodia theobromae]